MNANPDPFENDLRALQRRELPDRWRDAILQSATTAQRGPRPPRWLLASWGAAWAAIWVMNCTIPSEPDRPQSANVPDSIPPILWEQRAAAIAALLAAN
ncbi:MAG: hypothetical protein ACYC67_08845 [Prosthecobacter sp.]|jgi:hypothetical protein